MIDHIETSNLIPQAIIAKVQLPEGIRFNSDHRVFYTNMILETLIDLVPHKPV